MPELMKGNVWKDRKDARNRRGEPIVTYPLIAEIKYDEIRCHVKVQPNDHVEFLSYAGNPLANMERFSLSFQLLSEYMHYFEFDCGFEVNGNFNDSYRWVRSTNGVPADLTNATTRFILFDLPENPYSYTVRQVAIKATANRASFHTPTSQFCSNEAEIDAAFAWALDSGYEGLMIKRPNHTYQRRRTDDWLKMKPSEDADGVIISLLEAVSLEGEPLGRIGSIGITCDDGSFAQPHGIPHALGREMFNNPDNFIGQRCEFRYMMRDRQGGYRHPTFHRVRE